MDFERFRSDYDIPELPPERHETVANLFAREPVPSDTDHAAFAEWMHPDKITEREVVKRSRYTLVEYCETSNDQSVYVVSINHEDSPYDEKKTREHGERKIERRKFGYHLARTVRLPTVPHTFGESWAASKAFDGEYDTERFRMAPYHVDSFLTEIAANTILLNWDLSSDILADTDGNRVHIDVTPRFYSPMDSILRLVAEIQGLLMINTDYPGEILNIIMERAHDMGVYLLKNFEELVGQTPVTEKTAKTYFHALSYVVEKLPLGFDTTRVREPPERLRYNGVTTYFEPMDSPWDPIMDHIKSSQRPENGPAP